MVAQDTFIGPSVDWFALSPHLVLVGGALFLMVVGVLTPAWPRNLMSLTTVGFTVAAAVLSVFIWNDIGSEGPSAIVGGVLAVDRLSLFLTFAVLAATALVALMSDAELLGTDNDGPEIYSLLLVAATGALVMVGANELIVMFLGLETVSLALYVLAASDRRRSASQESGMKYFILGGLASAFFLYGIALLYGGTRTTSLADMVTRLQSQVNIGGNDTLVLAGLALMLIGFAFKVSAVPFHVWSPDVYQGAPSNITAFMASVGKVAAFGAMLRVLTSALPFYRDDWRPIIWVLAVLSLIVGSLLAVVQTDVKRMLAFSSVSHAGFILVGLEAAGLSAGENAMFSSVQSVAVYLGLYSVLVVGSFAVISVASRGGDTTLDGFNGLSSRRPTLALALTVFLLAQAGVPFTSGFVAKWGVIQSAVDAGSYWLAVIAMLAAVIAAFLYLRIMVSMWLRPADDNTEAVNVPGLSGIAIAGAAGFTLAIGIYPQWVLSVAEGILSFA
ncbi:MAG: NADH-quinone oxidoreductase subunit N [Ilumatobacteraceae bacterium]